MVGGGCKGVYFLSAGRKTISELHMDAPAPKILTKGFSGSLFCLLSVKALLRGIWPALPESRGMILKSKHGKSGKETWKKSILL